MNTNQALHFRNSQEWRKWLEENSNSFQEVWLVHYKKHSSKVSLSLNDAVEEALCFGWIDGKLKSVDEERFILRYSPRKANSVWSKINKDKAEQLIAQGRMTALGLVKIKEAKKNGSWEEAYTNKKKDEIPADLEEALLGNKTSWLNFQKFANSYRNMYIGWVIGAKTGATRKRRVAEVVKRSFLNKKPGIE
ncbi:MAG: YdeI/OmpD-associated family protein [Chloroflexota bacterium]